MCVQVVSRVNIVLDTIDEEAKNLKTVSAEVRSLPDSDEELKVTINNILHRPILASLYLESSGQEPDPVRPPEEGAPRHPPGRHAQDRGPGEL